MLLICTLELLWENLKRIKFLELCLAQWTFMHVSPFSSYEIPSHLYYALSKSNILYLSDDKIEELDSEGWPLE